MGRPPRGGRADAFLRLRRCQLSGNHTSDRRLHDGDAQDGRRMLRSNPHTTEIIDLDQQTITFIDHDKRSYSVVTFQQLQQQIADAAAKTKGAKTSSADGSQMNFEAHISSNGATRQIDGQTAKESLHTITMP